MITMQLNGYDLTIDTRQIKQVTMQADPPESYSFDPYVPVYVPRDIDLTFRLPRSAITIKENPMPTVQGTSMSFSPSQLPQSTEGFGRVVRVPTPHGPTTMTVKQAKREARRLRKLAKQIEKACR